MPAILETSTTISLAGKKVIARAYTLRAGKTLHVSRVDLFDTQKRLAAVAVVTYMLLDAK